MNQSDISNHSSHYSKKLLKFSHFYWSSDSEDYFSNARNTDWASVLLVPLLATVILAVTVFLLVVFRQNPTFVISTVAGCLIFITIYLVLTAMETSRQFLE
ncbi:unnamed protein product [Acanthoscelides obtectus]|uniref:Uncharacterized protein n=1 Tax=Acanthoscelides obtectus TaxID=200917 RepID=A0A9P0PKB1_ACAOB|nr:unnamed protein product [Acanthoscelides obtectus]CAH2016170.1 unnamed protein product [Acanthoscelides obtectus]CAK1626857.1 hypothetical protein AOBTE_LOCUS4117 [Acanthoscelides obtectus]CAK1626860.1 hypothetical protein AOBTE_LOCUS4120 [Acanthoscelides obtectus]